MAKVNIVLEGAFKGASVYKSMDNSCITTVGGWDLKPPYVTSYTLIDETNKDQYSLWKGALGVALLGGLGAVAGIGGKKKKEYLVAIEWEDGDKSLICIDDGHYKMLVKSMF